MSNSECWYHEVCGYVKESCELACVRYIEMKYLMENSNLPKAKQRPITLVPNKCDLEAFRKLQSIKDDIVNFVEHGNNLYIMSSTTGNGKSSWSIKLMLKYFDEIWAGNGLTPRALFIHVPTFLLKCKDFNNKDAEFEKLKKLLLEVDMVVWDDIAGVNISSYDYSQLLMYLDNRCLSEKTNIYTGNITNFNDMVNAVGAKLASRLWSNNTTIVEFKGVDRR